MLLFIHGPALQNGISKGKTVSLLDNSVPVFDDDDENDDDDDNDDANDGYDVITIMLMTTLI